MPMDIKRLLTPPAPVRAVPRSRPEQARAAPERPAPLPLVSEASSPLLLVEVPAGAKD